MLQRTELEKTEIRKLDFIFVKHIKRRDLNEHTEGQIFIV